MKSFINLREFLEANPSYDIVRSGIDSIGIDNPIKVDEINKALDRETERTFLTPYMAIGVISKVLAYVSIIIPQNTFLEIDGGVVIFDAPQFGQKDGYEAMKEAPQFYVYFEYTLNDEGTYTVFAQLVDIEDLEELVGADLDGDNEEGESEEHQEAVLGEAKKERFTIKQIGGDDGYQWNVLDNGRPLPGYNGMQKSEAVWRRDKLRKKHEQPVSGNSRLKEALEEVKCLDKEETERMDDTDPVKEEPINEISKVKLGKYIKRAADDVSFHSYVAGDAHKNGANMTKLSHDKKAFKRQKGIEKATDKIVKEETLDEVLKPSMGVAKYISDFSKSKNPKFKGKDKKKRIQQALAAFYAAKEKNQKKN